MAQSTILAAGTTVATSTSVTVPAGGLVTLGAFVASGAIPPDASLLVNVTTPGAALPIGSLNNMNPTMSVPGPCTISVTRNSPGGAGTSVGVFAEVGAIMPGGDPATSWTYAAAASGILNTTTAVTVKAAAGAGVRNYISSLELAWETLGAATEFAIRDGAAGTVIYRTKIGTAAGQKTINFPVPLRGTANTLVEVVTLTASVTGAVYANLQGFTGA